MHMRVLHTADLHIGKALHQRCLLRDQKHALDEIKNIIATQRVDVVLIAGDIYDTPHTKALATVVLSDFLTDVCKTLAVPVIMIPGNHDSGKKIAFASRLLEDANLHIVNELCAQPITMQKNDVIVDFYAMPYRTLPMLNAELQLDTDSTTEAYASLIEQWVCSPAGRPKIAIGHVHLAGALGCESERVIDSTVASRVFADFDYVALGHLHEPQSIARNIRYSGSPMKFSKSEANHKKSVTIITFDNNGLTDIEEHYLTPLRDMQVVEGYISDIVAQPGSEYYTYVSLLDENHIDSAYLNLKQHFPFLLKVEQPALITRHDTKVGYEEDFSEIIKGLHRSKTNSEIDDELFKYLMAEHETFMETLCD